MKGRHISFMWHLMKSCVLQLVGSMNYWKSRWW